MLHNLIPLDVKDLKTNHMTPTYLPNNQTPTNTKTPQFHPPHNSSKHTNSFVGMKNDTSHQANALLPPWITPQADENTDGGYKWRKETSKITKNQPAAIKPAKQPITKMSPPTILELYQKTTTVHTANILSPGKFHVSQGVKAKVF